MELNGHINAVAFSFDGKVLASGGHDRKIILWDPNKGERLTELKGHSSQVNGVSFSADGSLVASCSGNTTGFGGSGDCSVRMWSVETGQELKKFLGHRCVVSGCCSPFSASQRRSCCSRASCR